MTISERVLVWSVLMALAGAIGGCKATTPTDTVPVDSATFDPDGTTHITRIVPMPTTVSPEAQE